MPNPSRLSVHTNLEFLRKEAKALLKLCRSRDRDTLSRIRAGLPRLSEVDDQRAAAEILLVDVQHVLARELGFPNWGELKRHDERSKAAPDFDKPGADGVLPEGFVPWRWSVTHSVHPEMLSPLSSGREYKFVVSAGRRVDSVFAGYADLYARARAITQVRIQQLQCADQDRTLHSRIFAHGWFKHDTINFARAFITTGVVSLKAGEPAPQGEALPTPEDLTVPGGLTRLDATRSVPNRAFDEAYSDADVRDPLDPFANIFMFSYGEYVQSCEGVLYGPYVERAENFVRSYPLPLSAAPAKIIRREWWCVTSPDMVVVQVYVQFA
jgi:hypothetical protein